MEKLSLCGKGTVPQSQGGKLATIVVEAWCDRTLYIWSWFAGRAGTNNDLNVLAVSPLMRKILRGEFLFQLKDSYKITADGSERRQLYFLGDGIYPNWPLFAKPIHHPMNEREKVYTKRQEAIRKDIERCFGVLQSRFEVLRRENRRWTKGDVVRTSEVCAIIHNMLVKMVEAGDVMDDDGDNIIMELYNDEQEDANEVAEDDNSRVVPLQLGFQAYAESVVLREYQMTSRPAFLRLQDELIATFISDGNSSL